MTNINWIEYYKQQIGGQYNYYKGSQFQDGYGVVMDLVTCSVGLLAGLYP